MEICETHVVHVKVLGVTSSSVLLVGSDKELVTSFDGDLSSAPQFAFEVRNKLTSISSFIKPVRISGPLVSRAIARGRPPNCLAAARALSMTDWWYS
jgi:hypothetical protein